MKHVTFFAASIFIIIFIQGCAVQKELVPTGGSRADGTVKLSYEFGLFEVQKLDAQQGMKAAHTDLLNNNLDKIILVHANSITG
jgi:hypothetical protein